MNGAVWTEQRFNVPIQNANGSETYQHYWWPTYPTLTSSVIVKHVHAGDRGGLELAQPEPFKLRVGNGSWIRIRKVE